MSWRSKAVQLLFWSIAADHTAWFSANGELPAATQAGGTDRTICGKDGRVAAIGNQLEPGATDRA